MLTFEQMFIRFVIALVLGGLLGLERELVGKEAGVRTLMLVTSGAAIFLTMIANIVVGIGFLGAGLIVKTNDHPHGVTTAALVWTAAAIGILAGVGLYAFAVAATVIIAILLYILRKLNISEELGKGAAKK
jgi:putative Mg2+ transporter-C (MgtC) family protein